MFPSVWACFCSTLVINLNVSMFTCNWVMLLAVECFKCGFKAGDSAGSAVTVGSAREELSVFALFLHLQEATGC